MPTLKQQMVTVFLAAGAALTGTAAMAEGTPEEVSDVTAEEQVALSAEEQAEVKLLHVFSACMNDKTPAYREARKVVLPQIIEIQNRFIAQVEGMTDEARNEAIVQHNLKLQPPLTAEAVKQQIVADGWGRKEKETVAA